MRVVRARLRAGMLALVVAALAVGLTPAPSAAQEPPGTTAFMYAVGQVESGGRYDARNPTSGAYGKYQIMPANWPAWAERYLGNRYAPQTPQNQERVARAKMLDLHRWLGTWRQVAYWWLTGRDGRRIAWSSYATRYVHRVMSLYETRLGVRAAPADDRTWIGEGSARIAWSGTWKPAAHRSYLGGAVRYATGDGASATLTFTGTRVAVYGPMGPTRGRMIVRFDGRVVKVVDLYASSFLPRRALYSTRWSVPGEHTIQIEVEEVARRPYVAIDAFAVWP